MKKYSLSKRQSTIKKTALIFALLASSTGLLTPAASAQELTSGHNKQVRWQPDSAWKTEGNILDMVHTLDGKNIFFLTQDSKVKVYTTSGELLGSIPVPVETTHIDISPIGDKLYLFNRSKKEFNTISLTFQHSVDTTGAPAKGAVDAPISIVVFTDFQCPYCKKLPPVLEEIEKNNPGKVRIFFKNMPLISIHRMAEGAARAAIAAQNQGKFWPYHDKLFKAEQLSTEKFYEFAQELGLDLDQLETDMQSAETTKKLQKDMYDAQKAGVEGTPTIFINGWTLGDRSVKGFQRMIDTLSAEKK